MNESSSLNEKLIADSEPQVNAIQLTNPIQQKFDKNQQQIHEDKDAEKAFLQDGQQQQILQQEQKQKQKSNQDEQNIQIKKNIQVEKEFKEDNLFGENKKSNKKQNNKKSNSQNEGVYQKINPFLNKTPQEVYNDDLLDNLILPQTKLFYFRSQHNLQKNKHLKNVPKPIYDQVINISHFFDEYLETWDINHNTNIQFGLPETAFEGNQPVIQYQNPTYEVEKLELGVLTKKQFDQIWRDGSFEVPSKKFSTPYTWKLNVWLIKGRDNINESWRCDMGRLFSLYQVWKRVFYTKNNKYDLLDQLDERHVIKCVFQPQMIDGFKEILYQFPKRLFNLFFGHKWEHEQQITQKKQKIEELRAQYAIKSRKFQEQIVDFTLQSNDVLNKKKQIEDFFNKLEIEFMYNEWEKKLKPQFVKDLNENDEEYENQLEDIRQASFFKYVSEKYPKSEDNDNKIISNDIIDSIVNYLKAMRIITKFNDRYERKVTEFELEIDEKIKKQHAIKSKDYRWFRDETQRRKNENRKKEAKIREENIINEFKLQNLQSQQHIYSLFLDFEAHYLANQHSIDKQNQQGKSTSLKIFYLETEHIFPNIKFNKNQKIYQMENYETKEFYSNEYFWRLKIFFYRCKSIIITFTEGCIFLALYSPISFKAIFLCNKFPYEKKLKSPNGKEVEYRKTPVAKPIKVIFTDLLDDIKRDRQRFEDIPDTAFFGKTTSRFCNIIYNYFWRLFIVGIIGVLIFLPILYLLLDIILLSFSLVMWLVIPLVMFMGSVIRWLFFDWDRVISYNHTFGLYCFPLLSIILKLVFKGGLQLVSAICTIFVFIPVIFILMFVFSILRYICRSIYDVFTFGIIKCSARTPVREDNMARRIKGPGVEKNKSYFYTIDDEDVYLLIRAELEKLQLAEYESRVKRIIQKPLQKAKQIYSDSLNYFEVQRTDSFSELQNVQQIFINKLQQAINNRKASFPAFNANSVRFNDEELERLIPSTSEIIYGYVNQTNLQNYIWRQLRVKKDDFQTLSDVIWKRVFQNEDILEALSESEEIYRHEITKVKRKSINYLQDLEVNLDQQNLTKWNRTQLSKSNRKFKKKQEQILQFQMENFAGGQNNIEIQKILASGQTNKKKVLGSIQTQGYNKNNNNSNSRFASKQSKGGRRNRRISYDNQVEDCYLEDEYMIDQQQNQDNDYFQTKLQQNIQIQQQQEDYNRISSAELSDCDYRTDAVKKRYSSSIKVNKQKNKKQLQQVKQTDNHVVDIYSEHSSDNGGIEQAAHLQQIRIEEQKQQDCDEDLDQDQQSDKEIKQYQQVIQLGHNIQNNNNNNNNNNQIQQQQVNELNQFEQYRKDPEFVEIENIIIRNGPTKISKLFKLFVMVQQSVQNPATNYGGYYCLEQREYGMLLNKFNFDELKKKE